MSDSHVEMDPRAIGDDYDGEPEEDDPMEDD